jgi:uridine kinase
MAAFIRIETDHMQTRHLVIEKLADSIARIHRHHPIRVGIDGFAAAGKTTLVQELAIPLRQRCRHVICVSIDGFHNPAAIRHRQGRHCPQGYYQDSFDHQAILTHVLAPLGANGNRHFKAACYDYSKDTAVESDWEQAPVDAILLFDGIFLNRPELKDHWDFTVFVHADFSVILDRACQRDIEKFQSEKRIRESFEQRFIPGSRLYLEQERPYLKADIVLNNNHVQRPTVHTNVRSISDLESRPNREP